jgi:hypothetical protein
MQAWRREAEVKLYPVFNLCASWGWVVDVTPWLLYPQERALVLNVQEVGWASELCEQVWKSCLNNLQQPEYNCQAVMKTQLLVCNKPKRYPLDMYTQLRMYCLSVDYLTTQSIIQTVHYQYNFLIHYYLLYTYMDISCRNFNSQTLKIQVLDYMDRQQKYLVTTYRVRQYLIFVFIVGCCHLILCLSSFQGPIFRYDYYSAWMHTWKSSKWKQIAPYQFQFRSLNDHFTWTPTCIYECILIRTH